MFGTLPVADFGPTRLIAFREQLIKKKLARRTINRMVCRLRTVFRWGVSRELCSVDVLSRLQTVEPLQPNRGGRETSGTRGSVSWEDVVEKVLPFLPPLLQAFLTVLYHTGCRVGELRLLTTRQIDKSQEIWVVDLDQHKNSHRGKSRRIFFGPRAQAALLPWLLEKQPDDPIFSPLRVDERQPKRKGKRLPGPFYGRSSLQQVLRRAIERAGVDHSFSLAQLRHSCAVRITDACSLDVARQVLGHERSSMTSRYARDSDSAARKAASKIG
jgi:integrase